MLYKSMGTQRYKIVMLPTQKATEISLTSSGLIHLEGKQVSEFGVNQHLYIVDTEAEIEYKDNFIVFNTNIIGTQYRRYKESIITINSLGYDRKSCQKIIASTDNLGLQPIPQYIIDAYIADNNIELSIDEDGNICVVDAYEEELLEALDATENQEGDEHRRLELTLASYRKDKKQSESQVDLGRYYSLKHKQLDYEVVRLEKILLKEMGNGLRKDECVIWSEYTKAMKELALEVSLYY